MKKDYRKVCWYCGKEEVVANDGYYQCSNCGVIYEKAPAVEEAKWPNPKDDADEVFDGE